MKRTTETCENCDFLQKSAEQITRTLENEETTYRVDVCRLMPSSKPIDYPESHWCGYHSQLNKATPVKIVEG